MALLGPAESRYGFVTRRTTRAGRYYAPTKRVFVALMTHAPKGAWGMAIKTYPTHNF